MGGALGVLVVASAALNGGLLTCVYVLQDGLGLTPLHSALLSLPLAASLVAAAPASAVLLRRSGARVTVVTALVVLAAGLLLLARASGAVSFCAGFALVGWGFGTVMVVATHVVVRQAPAESAGVAGGLQQTAMNVGPVLGVASATVLMGFGAARSPSSCRRSRWRRPCRSAGRCPAVPVPHRPPARSAHVRVEATQRTPIMTSKGVRTRVPCATMRSEGVRAG